jgi:hypothetical protein
MKRLILIICYLAIFVIAASAQGAPPLTVQEADGVPKKSGISRIVVSNGTLTISGTTATINTSGTGSGLADPGANGILARTALGVTVARTLLGTAGEIAVANGDGVAGAPTFSLPSTLTFTGKTINGGTFSLPAIADFTNATHNHTNAAGGGQLNASSVFNAGTVPVARLPIMIGDAGAGGVAGLVPAPVAGDATKFLRGDGTWQTVTGGTGSPGGANTQLQYNNAGAFGGISGATSNGTNVTFGSANLRATSPNITTGVNDANGAAMFSFTPTASAVNGFSFTNAATGGSPTFGAAGSDADISLTFSPKGAGVNVFTKNLLMNVGAGSLDNLVYVGSAAAGTVNASFGFFVAGVGSSSASDGPYFLARGNGFNANTDQRGDLIFVAGAPTSPSGNQGAIRFLTGAGETERMQITRDGHILLTGATLAGLGTPANGVYNFCTDCNPNTDPCTSGGAGALAVRANGRWYCP